jgi:flagellar biosynthesis/type III secretory pathway chaperone
VAGMDIVWENFFDLIEEQDELHSSLVLVLNDEKRALEKVNLDKLSEANEKKESLSKKIRKLEDQRLEALEKLAVSLGQPIEGLTLNRLIRLTGIPYSERLVACRSRLQSLIKKIIKANNLNKSLLHHSIDLVKGSIALLNNATATNAVYFKTGRIQSNDKSGRIISQEI